MVKFIQYNGEQLPIKIAISALAGFENESGRNSSTIGQKVSDYEILFYYSLLAGHKIHKKEFNIQREDSKYILDEVFEDFIKLVKGENSTDEVDAKKKGQ